MLEPNPSICDHHPMVRPYYALLHYALHSLLEGRWQDQRNSAHQNSMSVADTKYSIYRPPATWPPLRTKAGGVKAEKSIVRLPERNPAADISIICEAVWYHMELHAGFIVRVLPQYPASSADVFLIFFSVIFSFFQNIKTFFC